MSVMAESRDVAVGNLVGSLLLVGLGRSVVLGLGALVGDGVASGVDAVTDAGISVALGDLLVGLLGSGGASALDLVGDVVAGVLDGIHFDGLGVVCLLGCVVCV